MSLQVLHKPMSTPKQVDVEACVGMEDAESMKENRVVTLRLPQSSGSPLRPLRNRTPPKRPSSDHALQAVKRMREQENALSCKIIQNLQNDKAAFAAKMEELQLSLQTSKQHCGMAEQTVKTLMSDNEQLEEANRVLEEQVDDLHKVSAEQASTISQLEIQLKQERTKQTAVMDPSDAELLALTKRYLKQSLQLQQIRGTQIRPASKTAWESDSLVAQCNGCSKRFGTFLRRHHCRGCGKLFCGACCQDNLHLLSDSNNDSVLGVMNGLAHLSASDDHKGLSIGRQRSCRSCFQQAEDVEIKKQQLKDRSKAELRAMEEWMARSGADLSDLLDEETAL